MKDEPIDIQHLSTSYTTAEQVEANKRYLREVDEELSILKEYEKEQFELRNYLANHIDKMKDID